MKKIRGYSSCTIAIFTIIQVVIAFFLFRLNQRDLSLKRPFVGSFETGYSKNDSTRMFYIVNKFSNFGPVPAKNCCIDVRYSLNDSTYKITTYKNIIFFPNQIQAYSFTISKKIPYSAIINGIVKLNMEISSEYDGPYGHYKTEQLLQYNHEKDEFTTLKGKLD